MAAIKVTILGTGEGTCALTQKETDGLTVSFENEPATFLSWKSFKQLLSMKAGHVKAEPKPAANGPAPLAAVAK